MYSCLCVFEWFLDNGTPRMLLFSLFQSVRRAVPAMALALWVPCFLLSAWAEGGLFPAAHQGQWGFIDARGRWAIAPQYQAVGRFVGGRARAQSLGKWGYLTASGRWAIKPWFYQATDFAEGLAAVQNPPGGRWGFIDAQGRFQLPPAYDQAFPFSDGLARVSAEGVWFFVTPQGDRLMISPDGREDGFREGLVAFRDDKAFWGYQDHAGQTLIAPTFHWAMPFSESLAAVRQDQHWGYIHKTGRFAILPRFEAARSFREGVASVQSDGKWGAITPKGRWAIAPDFERLGDFSQGLAAARQNNRWGYINRAGRWVIPPGYAMAWNFEDGLAQAQTQQGGFVYVNRRGGVVWPTEPAQAPSALSALREAHSHAP